MSFLLTELEVKPGSLILSFLSFLPISMKKELEAIPDEVEREETYKSFVEAVYERGRAENTASVLEIDTAIDPKDTRKWILSGLQMVPSMIPTWKQPAKGRL